MFGVVSADDDGYGMPGLFCTPVHRNELVVFIGFEVNDITAIFAVYGYAAIMRDITDNVVAHDG